MKFEQVFERIKEKETYYSFFWKIGFNRRKDKIFEKIVFKGQIKPKPTRVNCIATKDKPSTLICLLGWIKFTFTNIYQTMQKSLSYSIIYSLRQRNQSHYERVHRKKSYRLKICLEWFSNWEFCMITTDYL